MAVHKTQQNNKQNAPEQWMAPASLTLPPSNPTQPLSNTDLLLHIASSTLDECIEELECSKTIAIDLIACLKETLSKLKTSGIDSKSLDHYP
jgi:hypothetical protein